MVLAGRFAVLAAAIDLVHLVQEEGRTVVLGVEIVIRPRQRAMAHRVDGQFVQRQPFVLTQHWQAQQADVQPPGSNILQLCLRRLLGDLQRTADNPSAPEHGGARAAIAHLKAHRLAREAKVARAMQAKPEGTMDDWVKIAYDDVPERLWPVAKRSLLAHVERIQSLGGFNL